jgi:PII-like signaling protein
MQTGSTAKKVSIYINEGDQWQKKPLYLQLLEMLKQEGCAGGTVLRAVAGFTRSGKIQTTSIVTLAATRLPLVVQIIDEEERLKRILPKIREMVGSRLIITEDVVIA